MSNALTTVSLIFPLK